jgi:hypothetical protein
MHYIILQDYGCNMDHKYEEQHLDQNLPYL